ncbi:MAG: hypothetical protein JNK61_11910 [Bacteroidia bacterium]|nr:hypothetical protein [Bacteroidia bacterium]HQV00137.1 hypothetical protein [Bacteroidia bacterium]
MIKLLKNNVVLAFIATIGLTGVLFYIRYINGFNIETNGGMPLYNALLQILPVHFSNVYVCITYFLIIYQALFLNYILVSNEVLPKNTWLFAPVYALLLCFIPQFVTFNPVLVSGSFIIWAFDKILKSYKSNHTLALDFDIGLIIGVASLFYLPMVLKSILFAIGILILKPFSWRDWVVFLLGLLLPFFLLFVYFFLTNNESLIIIKGNEFKPAINWQQVIPTNFGISGGFLAILLVLSAFMVVNQFNKSVIKIRSTRQVTLATGIVAILVLLVNTPQTLYPFTLFCPAFSFLITFYLINIKRYWIGECIFWMLIAAVFFNHLIIATAR